MQIPFVGPTYNGRSKEVNSSRSINFFVEPSQDGASKSQMALIGTAGTKLWKRMGNSPIRAMYRFGGYLFVVSGTEVYRLDLSLNSVKVGDINTNNGPVIFTDNGISAQGVGGNQMIIIDGTYGYLYNLIDNSLVVHPSPNFPTPAKAAAYMDGYCIVSGGNMGITTSELYDASTFNGLAIAAAIATPDNIMTIVNLHQQLFIVKEYSTEVWYNTGMATQDGSPFARVSGAVMDYGTVAPYSVARGNNSTFFLAQQRIGDGSGAFIGVVELNGYTPEVVSPLAITYRMSKLTNREDAFAFCYVDEGHAFYQLTFPTDNVTFVYDATAKMWHERSTLSSPSEVTFNEFGTPSPKALLPNTSNRHLANCYAFFGDKHLVGDYRTGNIYEMSSDYYDDNGEVIVSSRTAPGIFDTDNQANIFTSKLVVNAQSGVGTGEWDLNPQGIGELADGSIFADGLTYAGAVLEISTQGNPMARLSWSNDGGNMWSNEYPSAMGQQGQYGTRLVWRRLGMSRDRVYKIVMSSATKRVITSAVVEASV